MFKVSGPYSKMQFGVLFSGFSRVDFIKPENPSCPQIQKQQNPDLLGVTATAQPLETHSNTWQEPLLGCRRQPPDRPVGPLPQGKIEGSVCEGHPNKEHPANILHRLGFHQNPFPKSATLSAAPLPKPANQDKGTRSLNCMRSFLIWEKGGERRPFMGLSCQPYVLLCGNHHFSPHCLIAYGAPKQKTALSLGPAEACKSGARAHSASPLRRWAPSRMQRAPLALGFFRLL